MLTDLVNDGPRSFLKVEVAGGLLEGLLEIGASVSCLGKNCLEWLGKLGVHWTRLKSFLRTVATRVSPNQF